MRLGYNTNGLAHHRLTDALALLGEIGYRCVAITIDHHALNPDEPNLIAEIDQTRAMLQSWGMSSVIETGARYLLDYRTKHEPTFMSAKAEDRERRIAFLRSAVDIARRLGSHCVSIWSGVVRGQDTEEVRWNRLLRGLHETLDYAEEHEVTVAFEPEPGMFIDTMSQYAQLCERLNRPSLRLTMDIGHLHCQGELPICEQIVAWRAHLANVHLEDMCAGVHEHLMFGEGEMDFAEILGALQDVSYPGPVNVELSRHSHEGAAVAQQAFDFLKRWF